MQRCRECNAPLTTAETVCYSCNSPVAGAAPKEFSDRFRMGINIIFIVFLLITVLALFFDSSSFIKCVAVLAVLYLVKNSADNMSEFRKKP